MPGWHAVSGRVRKLVDVSHVAADVDLGLPAPRSLWSIHRILLRRGRRQLFFLPLGVVKIGRTADERRLLDAEARGAAAAAIHPFWRDLCVRTMPLVGAGLAMRRFSPVAADDLPRVAAVVDARLAAMADYPRRPMLEDLEGRRIIAGLTAAERTGLARIVGRESLPRTSMHGDLHFLNFVRDGRGFRAIDWEHFDPDGSYAFDHLDFHLQLERVTRHDRSWADSITALDARHPAILRVAQAADADPRALLFHYLVTRIDITATRAAGVPGSDCAPILAILRQRLAIGA